MLCENLSFEHICKNCQISFLAPSIYKRKILNKIEVISFYKYSELKELLHTKHTDIGYYIYSILAKNSLKKFASEFKFENKVVSIAIDDGIKSGYSHTAILNKALCSKFIKPQFNRLRAKNSVSYSGKSREFRLLNPRNFELKNLKNQDLILVDDIITTGLTFTQAIEIAEKNNNTVLFCIALADASQIS
ncbi:ComF family protein [Sulfurimonas sp.]|uniref:phosphoribosyltransferase-like protein n=1 Tax=Sulfurimonas sp. TaxID=2022749 RepID=UPI00261B17B4|nr:ComF family protein [Sulfurimonas sp.]MDD5158169.1 ComF family protein [Sulfurimonas sp.]